MRGLRLGLIPLGTGVDRGMEFAAALGAALAEPIEIHKAPDYRALVAAFEQDLVHFAWLPPLAAARAMKTRTALPVALAVRNGVTSYMTGLIALNTSHVTGIAELKGVRAAWVDRESASGYLVIRAALRVAGVSLVDAFSEEIFVRSHAEVARAVHTGRVDVGATCLSFVDGSFEIARTGYKDEGGLPDSEVRVVAHAGPIPSDLFAVRASLPASKIRIIERALCDDTTRKLHSLAKALMHADGFARPTGDHASMLDKLFTMVTSR